ncbi:MAG TPA: molybdopterin cofactor-binding domain-containing protein [Sphingomonas sp.]|nr:molybdopterin cofactor-binding domain-containing protein [Sphingomonas sp.]
MSAAVDRLAPSRRTVLKVGAAAAGGLLVGFRWASADAATPPFAPNAFIRIDRASNVTLVMPNQEMGQGIYTAHSQLLAEELDIALNRVTLEAAPPDDELYGGPRKRQSTGGSSSLRAGFYPALRQAGADARALLVLAAARRWGVDPASCRTLEGRVFHDASGRAADYGDLADAAARLPAPREPAPLKAAADFRLIGKSVHRLDTPAKVNGGATYGIDVMAGQVPVAVPIACPVVGGTVRSVDDARARAFPGVRQVVVLDDLVAVVADHSWAAIKGAALLDIVWDEGPNAALGSTEIWDALRRDSTKPGANAKMEGDPDRALTDGDLVELDIEMPFLAHAPMEPLNCTVHVTEGRCEVWMGTQVQTRARATAAETAGVPVERVTLHNYMLGGAFGRRLDTDLVGIAVRIGREVDGPVKVMWTREEDMRHDVYRPAYRNIMRASLKGGRINGWSHKIAAGSVSARVSGKPLENGIDGGSVEGATEMPYTIPHRRVDYVQAEPKALRLGWWRGVGPNNTIFAIESFVDELAKKAGEDPVAFRLKMLDGAPRLANALKIVAAKSDWGAPLGARRGRGVSIQHAFGSFLATVAEVEVDEAGNVRVDRFVSAVDCGVIVNPNGVIAQMEGGLIFGMTAALFGDITVAKGRVEQGNFNDYRAVRINEAPRVEIHLVESSEDPGGIGEPPTTAAPPAIANAIAAATGIRLRRMPIDRDVLAGRKPA